MPIITELFYLPPIEHFVAIHNEKMVLLDIQENYQKQTYRNRCQIRLANKVETLSIPVLGGNKKIRTELVKIDYNQKWVNVHLRGIQSAYGKAPFFEYYFPYIEEVFQKKIDLLTDFNMELLTVCLKLLQLDIKVMKLDKSDTNSESIDIRGLISAKSPFEDRNIYQPAPYSQLFGLDFVPNLSIIDLLFCVGPESSNILVKSQKNH
ncbi:WbqC family protein [Belliella sp. DSM 107340]|uniref:WbqC family protein n=1 Tax=Belliella calami TaxID=2923436 RepID=A0ABS9UQW3_9BACT|nr:WbqC family protein [Belliella calami]MCH7399011.1 WbqC family protein [Belliella calami]